MTIYKAKKGKIGFYIQPDMIEDYAALGYEIVKLEEVVVTDVQSEVQSIANELSTYENNGKAVNADE